MGAETTTLRTIVELLMGFGRPDSGKVTVDGMVIADVHPGTLSQQLVWVGRDGPVWGGTVEENLRGNSTTVTTADMAEAAREVGIYDLIQSWDEGFTTHLSADDGRLDTRTRYGIAVARARLARPAVVVVDEPELKAGGEDPCFQVLKSLVKDGALVVMLASSVQTLQSSDRVMLIRNGKLETEGKHDEMLGTNDFYRHLNYQLFNPYRDS